MIVFVFVLWTMMPLQGPVSATSCDWSPPAYGGMFDFARNLFVERWQKVAGGKWHGESMLCDRTDACDGIDAWMKWIVTMNQSSLPTLPPILLDSFSGVWRFVECIVSVED
jgi:hypothetical protein